MNKHELEKIIKKYYSYENLLETKFNIQEDEMFDLIIVSPTWKPNFVFNEEYTIENLKIGSVSTYKISNTNKKFLFLRIGKGAPYMYDNLLLLHNIESNFIFLGSAGSLNENISVGDIVIPNTSISGDGASIYFDNDLRQPKLFKEISFEQKNINKVKTICDELNISIKNGIVFSTDTLLGEYYNLDTIIQMGAECIEQETAAFGKCLNIMDKNGVALLVISDSLITGQNYYEPLENKKGYLKTRTTRLQKIIDKLS